MCPHFKDQVCALEPEKGKVQEPFPVYYCLEGLRTDTHLGCPVFQSKAGEKEE